MEPATPANNLLKFLFAAGLAGSTVGFQDPDCKEPQKLVVE